MEKLFLWKKNKKKFLLLLTIFEVRVADDAIIREGGDKTSVNYNNNNNSVFMKLGIVRVNNIF